MSDNTAVVLIDVYNDFLHPDGKATAALAESLKDTNTIEHIKDAVAAARKAKIPIYYSLHQQYRDGQYTGMKHMNSMLESLQISKAFQTDSWGAKIYEGLDPDPQNGDIIISKHWNQSSFQNTDLDFQLRQRDITKIVFMGLVANTCLETSARVANEFGYHIIMLSDATAGWTTASKNAATEFSWPSFAQEVLTVSEWKATIGK